MMKLIYSSYMGKDDPLKGHKKYAVEFHSFTEQTFIKHLQSRHYSKSENVTLNKTDKNP